MSFKAVLSLSHTDYDSDSNPDNINLGIVDQYSGSKDMSLECMQYPDTDARWQEYFDLEGSTKTIKLSGTYIPSDGSWATLLAWKEKLEAFFNGYVFDNGIDIWLGVYVKDFYSTGVHLWLDRPIAPLLEWDGTPGIDAETTKLAQNSANNCPICISPQSMTLDIECGTSPVAKWSIEVVQRLPMTVDLEELYT